MGFDRSIRSLKVFWNHHGRTILSVGSCVLAASAVVEAIHATSNAKDIIDELKYQKFEAVGGIDTINADYSLTPKEVVSATWKCYIWTGLLLSGSIACSVASHVESNKRIEAAAVAYGSLLETYNSYRDNVRKIVKDKDFREINHGAARDMIERDISAIPPHIQKDIFKDSDESIEVLFRDDYSANIQGAYFKRTAEFVRRAELDFNRILKENGVASLNDWYDCLDLGHSDIGDYYGWDYNLDGPLFAIGVPENYCLAHDSVVVTALGLGKSSHTTYFETPRTIA